MLLVRRWSHRQTLAVRKPPTAAGFRERPSFVHPRDTSHCEIYLGDERTGSRRNKILRDRACAPPSPARSWRDLVGFGKSAIAGDHGWTDRRLTSGHRKTLGIKLFTLCLSLERCGTLRSIGTP